VKPLLFFSRQRGPIVVVLLTAVLALWAVAPGTPYTGPGNPLQFTRTDLTDTKVIGLTVDNGQHDLNAENLRRVWVRYTPTWLNALILNSELGEGQPEARQRGILAARTLGGELDSPRPVHPGKVTGTSSGLAWALATLATGNPDLTRIGTVAATGTLLLDGSVVSVGGVREKMATPALDDAAVVFVPAAQVEEFRASPRNSSETTTPVVGVVSVEQALGVLCVLNDLSDGSCSRFKGRSDSGSVSVTLSGRNAGLCRALVTHGYRVTCEEYRMNGLARIQLRNP
jgi:hypothetical protein